MLNTPEWTENDRYKIKSIQIQGFRIYFSKNRHHFLYKNDTHSISVHRESEYDSCQADQMINYNWQKLVASQHRTKSILHTAVDFDSLLFAKLNGMFALLN